MKNNSSTGKLTLGSRLALGFGVLILLMIALTVLGISRVSSINSGLATIGDVNSVKQRYAINFRGSVHDRAISLRDVTLVPTDAKVQAEIDLIQKLAGDYAASAGPLNTMIAREDTTAEERAALAKIQEVESRALPLSTKVIELRQAGKNEEAIRLLQEQARPVYVDWLASINRLIDLEEAKNKAESAAARGVAQGFQVLMLAVCALAIALGIVIAWLVTRGIVNELGAEPSVAASLVSAVACAARMPRAWPPPARRSRRATTTCRPHRTTGQRPGADRRLDGRAQLHRRRTPTTPARATSWRRTPPPWPSAAARWWARWWTP
jgi:methyl-accepting chemotaxis protein